jgi:hypothetical protein
MPSKLERGGVVFGFVVVVAAAIWLQAAPLPAVSACSSAACGACAPPTAGFGITTLIGPEDLPDTGDAVTAFVDPNDGTARRLVVSQEGIIWVWNGLTQQILPTPFLDLTARVLFPGAFGESGLLAMAVSPNYVADGEFYVYYTGEGAAPGDNGDVVIERYVRSANPDVANATPTSILVFDHPSANHNGGALAFGPDGYLYVSTGDGGGSCDNSSGGPNSQNINELLGKILRLDVDDVDPGATAPECESNQGYEIPTGNPYQGATSGCGEIWSIGLRNPFRMTFDRETGDIFFGDVGQGAWEEINFLRAGLSPPVNFGWKCREGCQTTTCTNNANDLCPDTLTPGTTTCQYGADIDTTGAEFFVYDPILCHSNSPWTSIMGGYMYRGDRVPELSNRYFYSDYSCGQLWVTSSFDRLNPAAATSTCWEDTGNGISGFAEDHLGEVYIVRGGDQRIDCIHDGGPRGCYWAGDGLFSDGFESEDTAAWSATVP